MMVTAAHSCEGMDRALADEWVALTYNPRIREFHVRVINVGDGALPFSDDEVYGQIRLVGGWLIDFCPWCGEALPGGVRGRYFRYAERALGANPLDVHDRFDKLPNALLSDAWWRQLELGPTNSVLREDWKKPAPVDGTIRYRAFDPGPGYERPAGVAPHMCEEMAECFEDVRNMIAYLPWAREYGIRVIDPGRPLDDQPQRVRPIHYCPWCGDRLPPSLRGEWERRLAAQGLDPETPDPPDELGTEAWWREAGL